MLVLVHQNHRLNQRQRLLIDLEWSQRYINEQFEAA